MIRTATNLVVSALLGVVIPLCALIVLGQVTVAVMLPEPPPGVREHVSISLFAIDLVAWLPPALLSVLIIRHIARDQAVACGIVAGLFAIVALVVAVVVPGDRGLSDAANLFWPQALLLIVLLPIACVLPFGREG